MIPLCKYCESLFAEMYSSNAEARAIQQDLQARIVSGKGIDENARKWYRIASKRCTSAAVNVSEHLAAHRFLPRRRQPTIKYRVSIRTDTEPT
jgi:hypothetical protein